LKLGYLHTAITSATEILLNRQIPFNKSIGNKKLNLVSFCFGGLFFSAKNNKTRTVAGSLTLSGVAL
ncbi:hypothetical protein J8Z83_22645, partial [Yersinia enterocolitica]|uniref:hypothetical protein n=1 Tax=Yersinia enterocolitica TaxID=630 RepID=UPI001C8D08C0